MNARPQAWLHQAKNDLAFAQLARDDNFLAQACDYASQAAEKALKGALLELGIEPSHTDMLNDRVRLGSAGVNIQAFLGLPLRGLSRWRSNRATPWMRPHCRICLIPVMPIRPSASPVRCSPLWKHSINPVNDESTRTLEACWLPLTP